MSELENKLDNLLAEDFGIDPTEVTGDFIRDWREKHLARDVVFEMESVYGGYLVDQSQIMTQDALDTVTVKSDAFLDRFSLASPL